MNAKDAIAQLAYTRRIVAERETQLAEAEMVLHASPLWSRVEDKHESLRRAKNKRAGAKAQAQEIAREAFKSTGNKTPHPAITIKVATALDCTWGIAQRAGQPLITIARDLSKYLPED